VSNNEKQVPFVLLPQTKLHNLYYKYYNYFPKKGDRDSIVVEFTTTYAISAYHQ